MFFNGLKGKCRLNIPRRVLTYLAIGLAALTAKGCNNYQSNQKCLPTSIVNLADNQGIPEQEIYNLIKKTVTQTKLSDLIAVEEENSIIYCSEGIVNFVRAVRNGDGSVGFLALGASGFYIESENTDSSNDLAINMVFAKSDLGIIGFRLRRKHNKLEITMKRDSDMNVHYEIEDSTAKRSIGYLDRPNTQGSTKVNSNTVNCYLSLEAQI